MNDDTISATLVSVNTAHEIEILESSSYSNFPSQRDSYFFSFVSICLLFAMIWLEAIKDHGNINTEGKSSVSYGILFDETANTRE